MSFGCARKGQRDVCFVLFLACYYQGVRNVNVIVHTIPRPPALLTALASSAYPTLGIQD